MTDLYDQGGGKFAPAIDHPTGLVECSNEEYHSGPGISKSSLDAIAISPLYYWDAYLNPDREPREEKHCFAVGDGTHKLVLEPGEFEKHYDVGFDKSKYPSALNTSDDLRQALAKHGEMVSSKAAKPELIRMLLEIDPAAEILAELERKYNEGLRGKTLIDAKSYKDMLGMLRAVNNHHTAPGLLFNASTEQSFYVVDQFGVLRKCRTDAITFDGRYVADLKTTDDVSEAGFGRTIAQRRYHVQAAWYLDILKMLYGADAPREFVFIAAQKTRPYDVAVHFLNEADIHLGRRLYQQDLATYIHCLRAGYWPGADGGEIIQARLPNWAEYQADAADLSGWNALAA
jgi:exodeoxyribonuclease VIII